MRIFQFECNDKDSYYDLVFIVVKKNNMTYYNNVANMLIKNSYNCEHPPKGYKEIYNE